VTRSEAEAKAKSEALHGPLKVVRPAVVPANVGMRSGVKPSDGGNR